MSGTSSTIGEVLRFHDNELDRLGDLTQRLTAAVIKDDGESLKNIHYRPLLSWRAVRLLQAAP